MFPFQVARIIIFILPAIELSCAIIIMTNLSAIKYVRYICLGLISLYLIDHLISFDVNFSIELFHQNLINPWQQTSLDSLFLNMNFIIFILLAISIGTLFYKAQDYLRPKPVIYLTFLLLLPIGIVDRPIYRNDFQSKQAEIPTATTGEKLLSIIGQNEDKCAVIFLSASCDACMQTSTLLGILTRNHHTSPIYLVFKSNDGTIQLFLEKSNNLNLNYINLEPAIDLDEIIGRGVPTAFLIENSKIVDTRKGIYVNFNFLDKLLK